MGVENFGELESDGGKSPKLSESVREAFSEKIREEQKKAKKDRKQEQKQKIFDDTLGDLIKAILADGNHDTLVLLVSELISKEVPSDFILAVLSLLKKEAMERSLEKLNELDGKVSLPAEIKREVGLENEIEVRVNEWLRVIYGVAKLEKEEVLASILDHNTWTCLPALPKLFFLVLKEELKKVGIIASEKEEIFSEEIFEKIIKNLEEELN